MLASKLINATLSLIVIKMTSKCRQKNRHLACRETANRKHMIPKHDLRELNDSESCIQRTGQLVSFMKSATARQVRQLKTIWSVEWPPPTHKKNKQKKKQAGNRDSLNVLKRHWVQIENSQLWQRLSTELRSPLHRTESLRSYKSLIWTWSSSWLQLIDSSPLKIKTKKMAGVHRLLLTRGYYNGLFPFYFFFYWYII